EPPGIGFAGPDVLDTHDTDRLRRTQEHPSRGRRGHPARHRWMVERVHSDRRRDTEHRGRYQKQARVVEPKLHRHPDANARPITDGHAIESAEFDAAALAWR